MLETDSVLRSLDRSLRQEVLVVAGNRSEIPLRGKNLLRIVVLLAACWTVNALPATQLAISNNPCLITPCPGNPQVPTTVAAGTSFGIYVAGLDSSGAHDNFFIGTVSFSSTDPLATLPGTYTFVPADGGAKAFVAILRTPGIQTITVRDVLGNLTPGNLVMTVTGPGVAPGAIPTISRSGMIVLALGLALSALVVLRPRP